MRDYVDRSGGPESCWPWLKNVVANGYGHVTSYQGGKGRGLIAHRVAYELANGPIPKGLYVLHKCDNRRCCNPSHLSLGTAQDNADDCVQKGRSQFGIKNPAAKFTESQVIRTRELFKVSRKSAWGYAKSVGATRAMYDQVVSGKTWLHLL